MHHVIPALARKMCPKIFLLSLPRPSWKALRRVQNWRKIVQDAQEASKRRQRGSKKRPRSAQEAPKSVQERPKVPTWLHLGGPRLSKIEAKTRKNRCWKTMCYRHRFWERSALVLEGFLKGFVNEKWTNMASVFFAKTCKICIFLKGKLIFSRFRR